MEELIEILVHIAVYGLEIIGIGIIVMAALRALLLFYKGGFSFDNTEVGLTLAKGMITALGFLLAAEILLSITVKTITSVVVLIGIATLRVGLSFVLDWEIKGATKEKEESA